MIDLKLILIIYILLLVLTHITTKIDYGEYTILFQFVFALLFSIVISTMLCRTSKDTFVTSLSSIPEYNDSLLHITPAKTCRGGLYLHQGDSDEAKMCRTMIETEPEKIAAVSCCNGTFGMPNKYQYESNITYN